MASFFLPNIFCGEFLTFCVCKKVSVICICDYFLSVQILIAHNLLLHRVPLIGLMGVNDSLSLTQKSNWSSKGWALMSENFNYFEVSITILAEFSSFFRSSVRIYKKKQNKQEQNLEKCWSFGCPVLAEVLSFSESSSGRRFISKFENQCLSFYFVILHSIIGKISEITFLAFQPFPFAF